jgi:hypothetical protein
MPKIENWAICRKDIGQHLIDRMRDRAISIADVNELRLWIESKPEVPICRFKMPWAQGN